MSSPARPSSSGQAHPLFAGDSPTKSPAPSSLVNRPIWGQRNAAKVDYSVESPSTRQRRSVSRSTSYRDGSGAEPSSASSSTSGHPPAHADDDVFTSRAAAADYGDHDHSTSYIPRTGRVSSYDLQFDDAEEASIEHESLFGGVLGDWASGLLPWSGGGALRKAAPSTAPSMVKATSPGRREMAESAAALDTAGKRSPNVTRLPDTYQFDRQGLDPSNSLSTLDSASMLGLPSPRPPSAAVELEPILPTDAAPPTLLRRKKKGRKSGSGVDAGTGSGAAKVKTDQSHSGLGSQTSDGQAGSSSPSADASVVARQRRAARLSTLDEEESSGDEFEVYGGKAPVPGFTNLTDTTAGAATLMPTGTMVADSSIVLRPVDDSDTDSDLEEDLEVLTDRYGFIYNPTDADIRLLRQARKASAPAPATLTGIKVGIRARGGTDSQSDDDKNDPDLDTADSSEDEMDLSRAVKVNRSVLPSQVDHNDVQLLAGSRSTSPAPSTGAASGMEGAASDDGGAAADGTGSKDKRAKRRSNLLTVPDSKPVQAELLPVSAVSRPSPSPTRSSPTKNRRGTRSNTSSRSASPVKGGGQANLGLPSISNTVRRLLTQLKDMHDTQQMEQKQRWDAFLERRRAQLHAADTNGTSSGSAAAQTHSSAAKTSIASSASSKTKALLAGGLFGGAPADGAKALSSAEKAPEEDWSSGMVGVNRMGDSKTGKEDWREFLALCQTGIPLCYRARIWAECSGANDIAEPGRYQELLSDHQGETNDCLTQIDLDVHRTMPTNIFFGGDGQGVAKLRRLLVAFSWYNPNTGYCQGMNNLAATLLLTHATEEEAFWVLVCLIEKILPSEYYTSHLLVSQADQRVLIDLVEEHMPRLHAHIAELGVDLPAITFAWFLSLYTDCLPVETLFRVWDVMFVEGMVILFRVAMAILKLYESELLATTSASSFYALAHSVTSRLFSTDRLVHLACTELKASIRYADILGRRERHVADLTVELGLNE
uniref:Rab-GAP TBC domain-containing protein n=1 Tax=Kalmanozyma brasiliensis (strain GHG001) TaxID=1365824 RepID=V5EAL6_KALBG